LMDIQSTVDPLVRMLASDDVQRRREASYLLSDYGGGTLVIAERLRALGLVPPEESVLPTVRGDRSSVAVIINEAFQSGSHGDTVRQVIESRVGKGDDVLIIPTVEAKQEEIERIVADHPHHIVIFHQSAGLRFPMFNDPQTIDAGLYDVDWMRQMGKKGVIFVFAIGNDSKMNLKIHPRLDNVLYVAAAESQKRGGSDQKAAYSDYGMDGYAFLAAKVPPGIPEGTSFSAPVVTGDFAHMLGSDHMLSPKQAVENEAVKARHSKDDWFDAHGFLGKGLLPGLFLFALVDPFGLRGAFGTVASTMIAWQGILYLALLLIVSIATGSFLRSLLKGIQIALGRAKTHVSTFFVRHIRVPAVLLSVFLLSGFAPTGAYWKDVVTNVLWWIMGSLIMGWIATTLYLKVQKQRMIEKAEPFRESLREKQKALEVICLQWKVKAAEFYPAIHEAEMANTEDAELFKRAVEGTKEYLTSVESIVDVSKLFLLAASKLPVSESIYKMIEDRMDSSIGHAAWFLEAIDELSGYIHSELLPRATKQYLARLEAELRHENMAASALWLESLFKLEAEGSAKGAKLGEAA
jgi:hypothetical protein